MPAASETPTLSPESAAAVKRGVDARLVRCGQAIQDALATHGCDMQITDADGRPALTLTARTGQDWNR